MCPCYYDNVSMVKLIREGAYFSESCFSENAVAEQITNINMEGAIKRCNNDDQRELYQEVTQCLGLKYAQIQELCLKTK